ncbi:hypothetical protein OG432_10820 [Streptomyces sp. NBC_00442]|uniref:hypothetical protein n=1 Tax=Streptomyces sp. NBC_00442 TaxID=2903651 RepID=UPI002E24107B
MKHSEKALANGWGWVLGVSGEECRVYSRPAQQAPAEDPAELLGRVTKLLGIDDPSQLPVAVRRLQVERKQALASAVTAWNAVHELTRQSGDQT